MQRLDALKAYLKHRDATTKKSTKNATSKNAVVLDAPSVRYYKMRTLQEIAVLRSNQKFFQHASLVASGKRDASTAKRGEEAMKILVDDHRKLLQRLDRYDVRRGAATSLFPLAESFDGTNKVSAVIRQFLVPLKAYANASPVAYLPDANDRLRKISHARAPVPGKTVDEALADVKREYKIFVASQNASKAVPITVSQLGVYTRHVLDEVMIVEQNKILFEAVLDRAKMENKFVRQAQTALGLFQKYVGAYKSAASVLARRPKTMKTSLARGSGIAFAKATVAFFNNVMRRVTRDGNLSLVIDRSVKPRRAGNNTRRPNASGAASAGSALSRRNSSDSLRLRDRNWTTTRSSTGPTGPTGSTGSTGSSFKSVSSMDWSYGSLPSNAVSLSNGSVTFRTSGENGADAARTIYELRSQIMQTELKLADMTRQRNAAKSQSNALQTLAQNVQNRLNAATSRARALEKFAKMDGRALDHVCDAYRETYDYVRRMNASSRGTLSNASKKKLRSMYDLTVAMCSS